MPTGIVVLLATALLADGCGGDDAEDATDGVSTVLTETGSAEHTLVTEAEDALAEALTLHPQG